LSIRYFSQCLQGREALRFVNIRLPTSLTSSFLIFYRKKFGLFHVNFSDPDRRRTPKSSAHIFSKIITQRDLPSYLLETTGKLPLKTTSSESITELNNSLNNFCTLQHTTANCGRMFFTYSRKFLFIWLATMMYSSCIFRS